MPLTPCGAGSDLFYEKSLTLSEALCGFKFAIPHLDGRQLLVSSNEGDVVKPGAFKAVYDEGMPTWQRTLDKGRLFIHFDVVFPEPGDLGDKEVAALADLLPPRPSLEVDIETCQEVSVSDVDMEQELRRQKERQMEDEDEEDPRGGRVQCAQQVRRLARRAQPAALVDAPFPARSKCAAAKRPCGDTRCSLRKRQRHRTDLSFAAPHEMRVTPLKRSRSGVMSLLPREYGAWGRRALQERGHLRTLVALVLAKRPDGALSSYRPSLVVFPSGTVLHPRARSVPTSVAGRPLRGVNTSGRLCLR